VAAIERAMAYASEIFRRTSRQDLKNLARLVALKDREYETPGILRRLADKLPLAINDPRQSIAIH